MIDNLVDDNKIIVEILTLSAKVGDLFRQLDRLMDSLPLPRQAAVLKALRMARIPWINEMDAIKTEAAWWQMIAESREKSVEVVDRFWCDAEDKADQLSDELRPYRRRSKDPDLNETIRRLHLQDGLSFGQIRLKLREINPHWCRADGSPYTYSQVKNRFNKNKPA